MFQMEVVESADSTDGCKQDSRCVTFDGTGEDGTRDDGLEVRAVKSLIKHQNDP